MIVMPSTSAELFYQYSKIVCGQDDLSRGLSDTYFNILNSDPTIQKDFQNLLEVFGKFTSSDLASPEKAVTNQILPDDAMRNTTLLIIKLWYLGIIAPIGNPANPLTKNGYYFHHEALIWKIAQAHPAGLSGGYYGYWAYKPEN
jgi:hypothetical protein